MGYYILFFSLYIMGCYIAQEIYLVRYSGGGRCLVRNISAFFIASAPIILFYGLRVGIGTDYWSYVAYYNGVKKIPIIEYWKLFFDNKVETEPLYHIINKAAYLIYDNEHTIFILTGLILFGLLFGILKKYKDISWPYAVFIYLLTQYCYAVNGARFSIAVLLVCLGVRYIIEEKPLAFLICILVAFMFHKTAMACIVFYCLKKFKNNKLSIGRDVFLYIGVIFSPLLLKLGLKIISEIPFFSPYFLEFNVNLSTNGSIKFLGRCLPPIIAILLLVKIYHISLNKYSLLINIEFCRIPLLFLGYYHMWMSRMERYAWISEMILVPYVVRNIKNKRQRILVSLGFVLWYIFMFWFYYILKDDYLFPYKWVFS